MLNIMCAPHQYLYNKLIYTCTRYNTMDCSFEMTRIIRPLFFCSPGNSSGGECVGVVCPPVLPQQCNPILPPGACCPVCGKYTIISLYTDTTTTKLSCFGLKTLFSYIFVLLSLSTNVKYCC